MMGSADLIRATAAREAELQRLKKMTSVFSSSFLWLTSVAAARPGKFWQ
jgi:hypothetical protein